MNWITVLLLLLQGALIDLFAGPVPLKPSIIIAIILLIALETQRKLTVWRERHRILAVMEAIQTAPALPKRDQNG